MLYIGRVRWIGYLYPEGMTFKMINCKRIIIKNMEILVLNSTQDHIHAAEIIGLGGQFLAPEAADIGMLL